MKFDWRDVATRVAICLAGAAVAVIFVLRGDADVLPPLAVGGAIGALLVTGATRHEQ